MRLIAEEKVKVLVIISDSLDYPHLSALPRALFEISTRLAQRFDFQIITGGPENRTYILDGIPVRQISSGSISFFKQINEMLEIQAYKVVHFYGTLLGANLLLRYCRKTKAGFVLSLYSDYFNVGDLKSVKIVDLYFDSSRIFKHPRFASALIPKRWLSHALNDDRVISVVTPSSRLKNRLERLTSRTNLIIQLPHGVDIARFADNRKEITMNLRKQLGFKEDDCIVLYYGRGSLIRGIDDIVYALSMAAEASLPFCVCFLLVESGTLKEDRQIVKITEMVKKLLPQGTAIIDVGFSKNLEDFVAMADIVALPYRFVGDIPEYPFALIESMAAGKAIITTNIGAVPELIKDGVNGVLVKPKDKASLSAAFCHLLKAKGLISRYGEEARKSVDGLGWQKVSERFADIYRSGNNDSSIQQFFDDFSEDYDKTAHAKSKGLAWLSLIEESFIQENINVDNGEKALCIGAGTGRDAQVLVRKGAIVCGIDVSEGMLNLAKQKLKDKASEFIVADVGEAIPYSDNEFDHVTCIRVLKYIPTWKRTIAEVARVVKPGGFFILEIANKVSLASLGTHGANYFTLRRNEVTTALVDSGFSIVAQTGGSRLPFPLYEVADNQLLLSFIIGIEKTINLVLPKGLFSRSIMFLCQKDK